MADLELQLKNIWFDAAGCQNAIMIKARDYMDKVADEMVDIFKQETMANGIGSGFMKGSAASVARKMLKEASFDKLLYTAGLDDGVWAGLSHEMYVRCVVVFFGNLNTWDGWSKPGEMVFSKGVTNEHESDPTIPAHPFAGGWLMPGDGVAEGIVNNTEAKIKSIFEGAVKALNAEINSPGFLSQFVRVG